MMSRLIFLKQSLTIRFPPNILCDPVKELTCISDEWVPKANACMQLNVRMIFINSMSLFRFICSEKTINTFCVRHVLDHTQLVKKPCLLSWDYSIYRM